MVEEKNPPWSLPWGQAPLRNQTDARFWDRTHWSWNSPFPGLKAWFDWLGSLQGAGRISESTPLCSRHHLCAGCRAPSMMGSSYSFLVLWQITVMELSWSLTTFHCVVLHGGKPSSVTVNFSNLITANQKCEEKHFLWVSGAQQAGQPTCGVWTYVFLSGRGKQSTPQILQHVKAAETPFKCWNFIWKLCNPFVFSRKGYG